MTYNELLQWKNNNGTLQLKPYNNKELSQLKS